MDLYWKIRGGDHSGNRMDMIGAGAAAQKCKRRDKKQGHTHPGMILMTSAAVTVQKNTRYQ